MEVDRVAVTNPGAGSIIKVNNQCGRFKFDLLKIEDPRTNTEALVQYNHNLVAIFGARNWNNFKTKQDYTVMHSPSSRTSRFLAISFW